MRKARWFAAAGLAATVSHGVMATAPGAQQAWSLEDIVSAPSVTGLALDGSASKVLYALRMADLAQDRVISVLRMVDVAHRSQREILIASSIERLRRVPGTRDWSALIDRGKGVQLYRIAPEGRLEELLAHPETVLSGHAENAVPSLSFDAPRRIGILSYDWSPDGKWLWYSVLRARPEPRRVRYDAELEQERYRTRTPLAAEVEFRIRSAAGEDYLVDSRPIADRLALSYGGNVSWQDSELSYRVERTSEEGSAGPELRSWDLAARKPGPRRALEKDGFAPPVRGPAGGELATTGIGPSRLLEEIMGDGTRRALGRVAFTLSDPRAAGNWIASDGRTAIVGTRDIAPARYGLQLVDRSGHREIENPGSFTRCDFTADLAMGVCVREGLALPPQLVVVRPGTGSVEQLVAVSPRHERIAPLAITPRTWVNRSGYSASGFVIWPRNFTRGRRYPAIVVTHGSDADERFANPALQWNYPVQYWAERGFLVLLINDPSPFQETVLAAAYGDWAAGTNHVGPAEVQRLVWTNGVHSFEDAIREMANDGLVDPARVGIAGYSRGSQMVNVTVTGSRMFRAASSGDGNFLEPAGYPSVRKSYQAIFGGSPYGPALAMYQNISPSLNAGKACTPVLQQMALAYEGALDFFQALRAAGVPAQIGLYPGESPASDETHLFHVPSNRLGAMRENVAWFDFWLLGRSETTYLAPERIAHWQAMAAQVPKRCAAPHSAPQRRSRGGG